MNVPAKNSENWKYHNLSFLQKLNYLSDFPHSFSEQHLKIEAVSSAYESFKNVLVFYNGEWVKTVSRWDDSVFFISEENADNFTGASSYDDVFNDLHNEKAKSKLTLQVKDNCVVSEPIHFLHIFAPLTNGSANKVFAVFPQIRVEVGVESQLKLIESFISTSEIEYFCNSSLWAKVQKRGHFSYVSYHNHSQNAVATHRLRLQQEASSCLRASTVSLGQKLLRNDMLIEVNDSEAECFANGLYLAKDQQMIDNHTEIRHEKGYNGSHQLYKGLLAGTGRAVFNGKIYIAKNAQKVDSSQINKNLLLSKKAQINTKPELEIYADDVKATHGATVGQLDPEELFYLQSRGISPDVAGPLLAKAFIDEVLFAVGDKSITKYLQSELGNKISEFVSVQ